MNFLETKKNLIIEIKIRKSEYNLVFYINYSYYLINNILFNIKYKKYNIYLCYNYIIIYLLNLIYNYYFI